MSLTVFSEKCDSSIVIELSSNESTYTAHEDWNWTNSGWNNWGGWTDSFWSNWG